MRAGGTTTLNIQLVAADSPGEGAPSDKEVLAILNPSDQPNPPTQPFAGRLLGSSIEFNLLFPPYQEVAVIENPGADPAPLTQPVAPSKGEGTLSLNACYPLQEQPITIILAYATPQGELFLIKPDGSKEPFTGTIWPWRSGVVEQVNPSA